MDRSDALARLSDHLLVCNCNEKVGTLAHEVAAAGSTAVVLIVQDAALWRAHPEWHPHLTEPQFFVVEGSPSDPTVLAQVSAPRARAAVILADPRHGELADAHSALIALAIEALNPRVHTIVDLVRSQNSRHLRNTSVDDVVCAAAVTERLLVQSLVTPWLKNVFKNLCSTRAGSGKLFLPVLPARLAGATVRSLSRSVITGDHPWVVCGVIRHDGPNGPHAELNPRDRDRPLAAGDQLIVISSAGAPDLGRLGVSS